MTGEEITQYEIYNPEVIYQQEKAQIDIAIATANKYPRNISRFIEEAIVTVTLDTETAESCNYALPRGGKTLQGPSVHLARILMQLYGNFRADSKIVSVDATHVTSRGIAWDLQKNTAVSVEVKRSILQNEYRNGQRTGKMVRMNEDMITVTGNAANAIALRNAVYSIIPRQYVDKVNKAAKSLVIGDISDETKFLQRRDQVFKSLRDNYNIQDADILFAIGKPGMSNVTGDDLLALIGFGQSIKDGDSTIEQIFKKPSGNPDTGEKNIIKRKQLLAAWEAKKKSLSAEDFANIERIIDTDEEASYDKAIKYLNAVEVKPKTTRKPKS